MRGGKERFGLSVEARVEKMPQTVFESPCSVSRKSEELIDLSTVFGLPPRVVFPRE